MNDTAPINSDLEPGARLGEWVLEEPIGRGGYAEVWRAHHNALTNRRVAIKIPHDADYAAALRREGVVQDRLEGEHILEVLGLDPDHDPPYLVVQLVEGSSLRERLEKGRVDVDEAVRLLTEITRGLQVAHARGVVHRDLKPENVLLDQDGKAFVADFGLGLINETVTTELLTSGSLRTQSGKDIAGTLRYMSPEQRDPEAEVDHRADLYALGVILFELLTGEAPCGGEVPSDVVPGLDPRLDKLFRRLCTRLATRLTSADEVLLELEQIGAHPAAAPRDPVQEGAARCVDVQAGLYWRFLAFILDLTPFLLLGLGPLLRVGRGLPAILLFVLYDVVATCLLGRTFGKWAVGLRVATKNGARPEFTQAFLRSALKVVSMAMGGIGYLPAITGGAALHDSLAETQVLHDSK